VPKACCWDILGGGGEANNPARSLIPPPPVALPLEAVACASSKSINDDCWVVELLDSSEGIGLAAKEKSPFLNASYRERTVLIWSLI
jgi:hypothetical protein